MAKLKFDVAGVERGARKQPTPGLYTGKIAKIESGQSKAGNDMLTVHLKITNRRGAQKEFKGTTVRTWVVTDNDATAWKLAEFLDAVGATNGGKKNKGAVDLDQLVGTEIQFKVDGSTYNGEYSASVSTLMALPGEDEGDEGDDDEADGPDLEEDDEGEDEADDEDEGEEDEEDEEDEADVADYSDLGIRDLKAEAKERGIKLPAKAKPKDIRELLIADDAEGGEEDDEEEDDGDEYGEWDKDELAEEAEARGLKKSGTKAQLVARLVEDDESAEDPFA